MEFWQKIENKIGSDREMDDISKLINKLLKILKARKNNMAPENPDNTITKDSEAPLIRNLQCKSVLIIDDLDRLDPDHMFRIFNIFSAHYDKIDDENKFGFEKVIFVCDFENIRKIFHHKYGEDVDFSGYTDKFYTYTPFYFDNNQIIRTHLHIILKSLSVDHQLMNAQLKISGHQTNFYRAAKSITNALIADDKINLRMLFRYPRLSVPQDFFADYHQDPQPRHLYPIIVLFYFLKNYFGSIEQVRKKLISLRDKISSVNLNANGSDLQEINREDGDLLIGYCLPFIVHQIYTENGEQNAKSAYIWRDPKLTHEISYNIPGQINKKYPYYFEFIEAKSLITGKPGIIHLNPLDIIVQTFDKCYELRAIV